MTSNAMTQEQLNALARQTLDAAYQVHTALGSGLLESAYTACLVYDGCSRWRFALKCRCRWSTETLP